MKTPFALCIVAASILLPALAPAFTLTTWEPNGTPVSTADGEQSVRDCVSDGAGGAFVVWLDARTGGYRDIYAQRTTGHGTMLWTTDGLPICTAANDQMQASVAADGAGGIIVAWTDQRNGGIPDIYAQRVNASGVVQWTLDGVPVCTQASSQSCAGVVSDGAGGAIVVWLDERISYGVKNVYAQRLDATGTALWTTDGVPICTLLPGQPFAGAVTDGAGGAIVTWSDSRNPSWDIYGQRINGQGVVQWAVNGVPICTNGYDQDYNSHTLAADGVGGALVTWREWVVDHYEVRAQRVDALGLLQWAVDGVRVHDDWVDQRDPDIVPDGTGGAIVAWADSTVTGQDIHAQRISAAGALQWVYGGVALSAAPGDQNAPRMVSDGSGGAVVTWRDLRSDGGDVYAQRVNAYGVVQWDPDGMPACVIAGIQFANVAVSDGAGGAIVAWSDYRTGLFGNIYAQRIEGRYGQWGYPEPLLTSVTDVPADQGGKVRVNWYPSGRELLNDQFISHYTIWRAASAAAAASAMQAGAPEVGVADVGKTFAGPAIRREETDAGTSFWELVGTQDAIYLEAYSLTVATGYDSIAANPANHDFQVVAHAYNSQYINWPSNVVSGHSVDNLAPAAPLMLAAQRVGSDVQLHWNGVHVSDLKNYTVYRATASGVTPVQTNFLSDAVDSMLVDANAPTSALYYIVTASDVHANQSAPSNEASVSALTGVEDTPALITKLTVLQNSPNPFAVQTEFQVGLPAPSDVRVEIYDVAGRRVSSSVVRGAAGWQRIPFSGRDAGGRSLASGVYFYRVHAGGETVTRKIVIAR